MDTTGYWQLIHADRISQLRKAWANEWKIDSSGQFILNLHHAVGRVWVVNGVVNWQCQLKGRPRYFTTPTWCADTVEQAKGLALLAAIKEELLPV